MNPLEGLIQQLLGQAGPRGATFAGRAIPQGQNPSLEDILGRFPQGETESGGIAMQAPQLLQAMIGGSLASLAKGLKGKFPTAIVNEAGHPKLLYHGTPQAFGEFDLSKAKPGLYGKGFYLTDDPSITEGYATPPSKYLVNKETGQFLAPNVRPAFVRMQKPFDIEQTYLVSAFPTELQKTIKQGHAASWRKVEPSVPPPTIGPNQKLSGQDIFELLDMAGHAATQLQKAGYDGITHIGGQISGGKPHRVYIAFDPKQVVSAFDPSLQALEQQLGPETMKALTTPGKSEFTVAMPAQLEAFVRAKKTMPTAVQSLYDPLAHKTIADLRSIGQTALDLWQEGSSSDIKNIKQAQRIKDWLQQLR